MHHSGTYSSALLPSAVIYKPRFGSALIALQCEQTYKHSSASTAAPSFSLKNFRHSVKYHGRSHCRTSAFTTHWTGVVYHEQHSKIRHTNINRFFIPVTLVSFSVLLSYGHQSAFNCQGWRGQMVIFLLLLTESTPESKHTFLIVQTLSRNLLFTLKHWKNLIKSHSISDDNLTTKCVSKVS